MDKRKLYIAATIGVAIVAYSIGYNRATVRAFDAFGEVASKEGMMYLAAQDAIRHRFGR